MWMRRNWRNFKYLECVLNEIGTDDAECCRKIVSERKVAGVYILSVRG